MDYDREDDEPEVFIRPSKEVKESDVPQLNEEWANEMKQTADDLSFQAFLIDSKLETYKEALALLQPHASGRIDIKFWRGYVPGKHPYAIVWKGLGRGRVLPLPKGMKKDKNRSLKQRTSDKYYYAPFKLGATGLRLRAKRSGKFLDSVKQVKELLGKIERLLAMRAKIVETGRKYRIQARQLINYQKADIRKMSEEIDEMMPKWRAFAEARYDELSERRRDHIVLLEQEAARQERRGYQIANQEPKPGE